jgi:hypothetical protein
MKRITIVTIVHTAGLFVALGVLGGNAVAAAKEAPTNLSISQQRAIEREISSLAYDVIRLNNKVQGQGVISRPKVAYDQATKIIAIDLGRNAVPSEYTPSFESQLALIERNVFETVGDQLEINRIDFLFDGVDIYHFFPDYRPEESAAPLAGRYVLPTTAAEPVMVISAGHGLYKKRPTSTTQAEWVYQRDPVILGEREDLVTPLFASALSTWVGTRSSNVTKYLTRSTSSATYVDACAGNPSECPPFKNMAARYYLAGLLPDRPDIWNSYSQEQPNHQLAHQYDDIKSRPKYAVYLQADQLISLHTNSLSDSGTPQTTASGTRVYYHTDRATSSLLATNIACSMKELIRTNPTYANWETNTNPSTSYGENTHAGTVPSVIVELGFGDNTSDAMALKNATFQDLAAKGIEKGARLAREGKDCAIFSVSTENVSGPQGTTVPVTNNYTGNPRFPLTRTSVVTNCSGGSCFGRTTVIQQAISPIMTTFSCGGITGTQPLTAVFHVTWVDSDGVKAEQDYSATCTPS